MELNQIINKAGSKAELSRIAGCTRQAVGTWKRVPAERVRAISNALDIPKHIIRPDIYIEADQ